MANETFHLCEILIKLYPEWGQKVKVQDFSSLIESTATPEYSFGLLTKKFSFLEVVI
jgi:hypothetical protein